jgi:alpha-beta hydrolase superfamily lysophospholipase
LNVVNHLVPRGYVVYGFDLRGHGRSPGPRGYISSWADYRTDVKAFLGMIREQDTLSAGRPLFLMGHSMGGLIVLQYALHHPDGLRGVIASGPILGQVGVSPLLLTLSRILSRIWPRLALSTGLDASAISRDPAVVKAYGEDPLVHSVGTPRLGTELEAAMERTMQRAADWQLPLLILHGGADRLAPAELSRLFFETVNVADKTRIEYEGGYHEPHNDTIHQRVVADLEGWLADHLGPDRDRAPA